VVAEPAEELERSEGVRRFDRSPRAFVKGSSERPQQLERLDLPGGGVGREERVVGDPVAQVAVLRARARRIRPDDDRDRRPIQMEERVNRPRSGADDPDVPFAKMLDRSEFELPHHEPVGVPVLLLELVARVEARALENVKYTGETVLVNLRRTVDPEECLDGEALVRVNDDRGRSEGVLQIPLPRQKRRFVHPFDDALGRDVVARPERRELGLGHLLEEPLVEVASVPRGENPRAQLIEEFHGAFSPLLPPMRSGAPHAI
jgi:hypothetical protein